MLTRCKNADLALCCGVCRATISYIHTVILTPSRRRRYMHAMQSTLNKLKLCSSTNPYSSNHLHSALLSITDSQEGKSYLVTGDSFLWRLDGYQWRVHHKRLCMNGRRVDMQWYSGATVREVGRIARRMGPLRLGRCSAVVLYIGSNDLLTPGVHRSLLWGKDVTFTCALSLISAQMWLHNKTVCRCFWLLKTMIAGRMSNAHRDSALVYPAMEV